MTPEQHYERGMHLLQHAEEVGADGDWARASTSAAIAHGHFSAAAAGTAMRAFEAMIEPSETAGQPKEQP